MYAFIVFSFDQWLWLCVMCQSHGKLTCGRQRTARLVKYTQKEEEEEEKEKEEEEEE